MIKDDARGGKEDRQMRLPGCRRGSCTPLCTQPVYRPSRVMRCDCTAYDCVFRTRHRLDRLCVPISSSNSISTCRKYRPTEKHDCDRYFVTRSSERDARFFVYQQQRRRFYIACSGSLKTKFIPHARLYSLNFALLTSVYFISILFLLYIFFMLYIYLCFYYIFLGILYIFLT